MQRDTRYHWGLNDRLEKISDAFRGITCTFGHDQLSNLAWAQYSDGKTDLRMPDAVGNLFRRQDRGDRQYGPAGELLASSTDKGVVRRRPRGIATRDPHAAPWSGLRGALTLVWPVQVSVGFAMDALHRLSRHGHPLVAQAVRDVMDEATCLLPKESLLRTQDGLTKY